MKRAKPAGVFRVLHTADWHLGKPLGDLSRDEEHARFLEFLLTLIIDEEVDALIVAGDVFDSANPPQSALRQYYQFLSKLYAARQCSVVIIAGNHDSPAQLEAPREVLETLRASVVGQALDDPVVLLPDPQEPRLAVAAIPFLRDRDLRVGQMGQGAESIRQALVEGIARRYADAATLVEKYDLPALATGHLTVSGAKVSDSERDIHVGGLGTVSTKVFPPAFDYVALGHLHRPQLCGDLENVRYSGSPIPLSFGEALDTKSVQMLDFDRDGLASQEAVPLPMWRRLVQMRSRRDELQEIMAAGVELQGELETWVEVVIEDPVAGENVLDLVRDAAEGKPFKVVRVVAAGRRRTSGVSTEDAGGDAGEDLLQDPVEVFRLRLDREEGIAENEREAIELAFRQVVERHREEAGA